MESRRQPRKPGAFARFRGPSSREEGDCLEFGVNTVRFSYSPETLYPNGSLFTLVRPDKFIPEVLKLSPWETLRNQLFLSGWIHQLRLWGIEHEGELRDFRLPRTRYLEHAYDHRPLPSAERFAAHTDYVKRVENQNYLTFHEMNAQILHRLCEIARDKELLPILLEMPRSPKAREARAPILKHYEGFIKRLSRNLDVEYWDLNPSLHFDDADFYDFSHLLPAARPRFQSAVLGKIRARSDPRLYRSGREAENGPGFASP